MNQESEIRNTVFNFVKKKYAELGEKIYGTYHNGSYGYSFPTRQVDVCKHGDGFSISYYCGERDWFFNFTKAEITDKPTDK
jgi:hypothetical protein